MRKSQMFTMTEQMYQKLIRFSADIRIETLRMIARAGSGHIGGSMSIADILAVLYGGVMRVKPDHPRWKERDYLILSKGHSAPSLYAALALRGFFPKEWLSTLNQPRTRLPSHADGKLVPGIDMSTGSLGQGISVALGIALGNRLQSIDNWTYCIVGDGELNEGEVWEACAVANHFRVDRLIVFVDWNKKQVDGELGQVCDPCDIASKFRAFGFDVHETLGSSVKAIYQAINSAKKNKGKPHVIVLDTIKGLGTYFAEETFFNHSMAFDLDHAETAIDEIERRLLAGTYPFGGKNHVANQL